MAEKSTSVQSGSIVNKVFPLITSTLYQLLIISTLLFLIAPIAIVIVISFQANPYGIWPPQEFTLEWFAGLPDMMEFNNFWATLQTSLILAILTAMISTALGGVTAFAIVRYEMKYTTLIETIALTPLIYPWIVIGAILLLFFRQINGVTPFEVTLSFWTVLVGHVVFTFPFPVRTIGANLQNFNYSLEEAAQNLGANELDTYISITFPLIRPGIISGIVFALVLSFNQYIISLFLTDTETTTIPLLLFNLFYNQTIASVSALATILMVGTLSVVLLAEYTVGISEYL
jgi:putative spermidine/putrescine transport system permease protein